MENAKIPEENGKTFYYCQILIIKSSVEKQTAVISIIFKRFLFNFKDRLAPVLKIIFHQCVMSLYL